MSTRSWPQPAVRVWTLAQRFQKFILVGACGLAVNQGLLFALHGGGNVKLAIASPAAIFVSMIATFLLNEHWTWHDRGSGPILHRLFAYFPINTVGLAINYGVLAVLYNDHEVHYLFANLVGAGVAAVWNFALNNMVTWRD